MKYEFQVRMQQRHLKAIVGALRFRQRLISGDVYGTLGRAAIDAWEALPDVAQGAYPARRGDKGAVQLEVLKACRAIEDIVWHQKRPVQIFSASPDGMLASELLSQSATKERHTRFVVKLKKGVLRKIGWVVELELRARIGHMDAIVAQCWPVPAFSTPSQQAMSPFWTYADGLMGDFLRRRNLDIENILLLCGRCIAR